MAARTTGWQLGGRRLSANSATEGNAEAVAHYFALCLAVKDQHTDIREWLEYHRRLGASKVYVFDNNSTVPMLSEFLDLVKSGFVDYHYVGNFSHPTGKPQLYIYDTCLQRYGRRHQFLGFFDCDEFLVINDASIPDMPRLLRAYEAYGALAVNWQMFGSSGHLMRPEGGVLANYRACFPPGHGENRHIKTIANTQFTVGVGRDPHHFIYQEGKFAVNERFEPINGAMAESVATSKVVLRHYVTKSREDWDGKTRRGSAMGNHKPDTYFDTIQRMATENCSVIV